MQTSQIDLVAFGPEHLEAAVQLSRQAGWPHRLEDWQMAFILSKGAVAIEGGRVVGTVLTTSYEADCAAINMVIVDEAMRGRGLGRKLMDAALEIAGSRPLRLVATEQGLPLYEKLGFQKTGAIRQHQGVAGKIAALPGTEAATRSRSSRPRSAGSSRAPTDLAIARWAMLPDKPPALSSLRRAASR